MYTGDNKNTEADHTTENMKTDGTAPMLQPDNGKDNLQETLNDTHSLGAIPQKSGKKYTTKGGTNTPSKQTF